MSTLNTANFGSDDEEDQDFVLPPTKPAKKNGQSSKKRTRGSQSPSSSSDSDGSEVDKDDEMKNEAKRLKVEAEEAQALRREKEAEETYKAMLAESTLDHRPKVEAKVEMVEIKRPRQFAGETIFETVSLPKDHPEAIAYLARQADPASITTSSNTADAISSATSTTQSTKSPTTTPTLTNTQPPQPSTTTPPQPKAKGKGPIKRKPRQSLESMSAALDKGKKMTTLEKSQMDWKSHTSSDPSIQAELDANRRGGGYLEKQNFLDRVGERRTGALEGSNT